MTVLLLGIQSEGGRVMTERFSLGESLVQSPAPAPRCCCLAEK